MPSISARGGRKRRPVSEINVVPYIDVMLVLLVIFMVTAPMITTGTIDVPTAGRAPAAQPDTFAQVEVREKGPLTLRLQAPPRAASPAAEPREFDRTDRKGLADAIAAMRADLPELPVLIAAEKGVRYEAVMEVMAELQRQGVVRIALAVRAP